MREKQIKGLNLDEITEICVANGFTPFRAKQIFHWMYRHGVTDIEEMNNIPDKIKNFISENFIFSTLEIDKIQESGNRVSVFIAESLMGCGGQLVPPQGFLKSFSPLNFVAKIFPKLV